MEMKLEQKLSKKIRKLIILVLDEGGGLNERNTETSHKFTFE